MVKKEKDFKTKKKKTEQGNKMEWINVAIINVP
jgi:hypothetical protein